MALVSFPPHNLRNRHVVISDSRKLKTYGFRRVSIDIHWHVHASFLIIDRKLEKLKWG
jgi:hypothetical protein